MCAALERNLCFWLPFCCCFRSEEHTSELQSRFDLVCRLLLEKKKKTISLLSVPLPTHADCLGRASTKRRVLVQTWSIRIATQLVTTPPPSRALTCSWTMDFQT